jgi:hypothetical protein
MKPLLAPAEISWARLIPVLFAACYLFILFAPPARALDFPWAVMIPQNDSRDPDVRAHDEEETAQMLSVINQSEKVFHHHLVMLKVPIYKLLSVETPFCDLHFDAVKSFGFTPEEKAILTEYLKRGGFILPFVDCYPYSQNEFWSVSDWPVIDFLTRELPARDPDFTVGRVTEDFPLFKIYYQPEVPYSIRHELTGNPNTPNRIIVFYKRRLCCFVMGRYNILEDDAWVPEPRPFDSTFSMDPRGYHLIVNVYTYALMQ